MTEKLLQAINNYKKLRINWILGLFIQYSILQSKYNYTLNQKQSLI